MREKKRKRVYDWVTKNYQVIIRNEADFAEKRTFTYNYAKISFLISFLFAVVFVTGVLFDRHVIGSDEEAQRAVIEQKVIEVSEANEVLTHEIEQRDQFIHSVKTMISGGELAPEDAKEVAETDGVNLSNLPTFQEEHDHGHTHGSEEEEGELQQGVAILPASNNSKSPIAPGTLFFPPLQGFSVSEKYNPQQDLFGVRIKAKENEPVTAIAPGTVIMASWTSKDGYIIALQHDNNVISIYKHNSVLLKKVGNFVRAGDLLAVVGSGGEQQEDIFLQFELWQDGSSLNPEHFISF